MTCETCPCPERRTTEAFSGSSGVCGWRPWAQVTGLLAVLLFCSLSWPATKASMCRAEEKQPAIERSIFVPFDDLPVILGGANQRVFLTRAEFQELEALARKKPATAAPIAALPLNSRYVIEVKDQLATIRGELQLDVLNPGLQTIPLPMSGVQLRSARLDDQPAPVGRDEAGNVVLFVQGEGRHQLQLELLSPITISAAQQSLGLQLPQAASSRLLVNVPGNVEIKSGATVVQRQFDEPTNITRFELVTGRGPLALVMSLNNRRLRDDRVVVARGVYVSEVTTTYERLHATISLDVLHGAVDQFLLDVPEGFQITDVSSPLMSQWVIRSQDGQEILDVKLREATRATEVLNIAAIRTPVDVTNWTMPKLAPRDVASHVAVVGLLAETHLQPQVVNSEKLIRIDNSNLSAALPPSLFDAEPGAPSVRPIVAFYAPQQDYTLNVALKDPLDELRVAAHLLLSLSETQQDLRGGFTLTPLARKRTSFSFRMPGDWQLTSLYVQEGQQLKFDQYRLDEDARYVVKLPTAIEPGVSQTVYFQATRTSSKWLDDWETTEVVFPHVAVDDATLANSAIAVQANGDFTVKPSMTEGLSPLDSSQRSRFGLDDSSTELTYEFSSEDFRARFEVQRIRPRISTRNYSFFRIREGALIAHYEVVFVIERAHARKLELELPASTPAALAIRGLDGVELKEFTQVTEQNRRVWTILLATARQGSVRLAVDFEQRLGDEDLDDLTLPLVQALNVAYQTQMTAVEGDSALDIKVQTAMRPVDIGELAEAEYTPGRRLLGAFASTAIDDSVNVDVTRRNLTPLPTAVVQRAELVTLVSSSGESQTSARYLLRTKVPFLAIRLPADAELWSVALNGKPIKPRRRGDQVLLGLQTDDAGQDRDLQVVFEAPISSVHWVGRIATDAPRLWLVSEEQGSGVPVPQVDLVWRVFLPTGFEISRVQGTVFSDEIAQAPSPAISLGRAVVGVGGGVHGRAA